MIAVRQSLKIATLLAALMPAAAIAQVVPTSGDEAEDSVFDENWLTVGVGVGLVPSYDGSDDYVAFPAPLVRGEVLGIGISPRPAGVALDFVPNPDEGLGFSFGPSIRLRSNRAAKIADPAVEALGKLDRALEIGPTLGVSIPKVLHDYDSLSIGTDIRWDVAGAHGGMVVAPSVTYFTPLSRGAAAALVLDAEYGDDSFINYYYSVSPAGSAASGLSAFDAGSGFTRAGVTLIGGIDLNGDLTDGGLAVVFLGGYSHMLGDAKASPLTSERGSASQWVGGLGLGYTF